MRDASMCFVSKLVKPLGMQGADRMSVAPAKSVRHSPPGGFFVEDRDGAQHACACVFTLIAHVGRCSAVDLPEGSGHRIATPQT